MNLEKPPGMHSGTKLCKSPLGFPERDNIPEDVISPLVAEVLGTIYALRGFRPNAEDLSLLTVSAKQFVTLTMTKSRHRRARLALRLMLSKKKNIMRLLALLRSGFSVTATKELIKGTNAEQFELAISATRLIARASETFAATQFQGEFQGRQILVIRLLFRAILGAPMTAFFLQLMGEGYERKLRKSMRLLEDLISCCEINSSQSPSIQKPQISQQLQDVTDGLISEFKQIWRDFSLFRLYHIA